MGSGSPWFGSLGEGPLSPVADAVPGSLQWLIAALGAVATLMLGMGLLVARRAGVEARRRRALLDDIGLLQSALLPPVPERVGGLAASVAYRPWSGPGAGGDFYDVFPLADARAGVVLGDVAGHGREVIGRTSALRHTLRAYLEAGLEPREALELAGRVLERDDDAPLATAVLGVHDAAAGTFTWAAAGHPAPLVLGDAAGDSPTGVAAPPLGAGIPTGIRQSTLPLAPGSAVCLFSDGLPDARVGEERLGRDGLTSLARELGPDLTATALLERVRGEALEVTDDMAVCVLRPAGARARVEGTAAAGQREHAGEAARMEELALPASELSTSTMQRFLWACGVEADEALGVMSTARETVRIGANGVLLRVRVDRGEPVEVTPLEPAALAAAR